MTTNDTNDTTTIDCTDLSTDDDIQGRIDVRVNHGIG